MRPSRILTRPPSRFVHGPALALALVITGCTGKDGPVDNQSPTCVVTSPLEGDVFLSGTEVSLIADIDDPEGDALSIYWTSTASGAIADGADTSAVLPDGAQIVTVQVLDDEGHACDASVSVVVDLPPSLTILFPADLDTVSSGSIGLSATVSDEDDDTTDLVLSWSDSVLGELGSANAGTDGTATVIAALGTPGPHTLTATATDPAGATASASIDVIVDTPPESPEITITPGEPVTGDDLVGSVVTDSVDADGDVVTYSWVWYVDGVLSTASSTDTLPADATSKGQVWTARAVPNDGVMDGVAGEALVTIGNTAPTMTSLTLSPDPLHTNENASGVPLDEDPDGDAISYTWVWSVNGNHVIDTDDSFASFNFERGDTVKVQATPSDGDLEGEAITTSTTVANSAPDNLEVSATPSPIEGVDDIVCAVTNVRDLDDDPVSISVVWTRDGAAYTDATTSTHDGDTVPAAAISVGEVWECTASANDGFEDGVPVVSSATARACAGGDESCPVDDCQAALDQGGSGGDGVYWLDLEGWVVEAWCDMTLDGGGWTLLVRSSDDGVTTFTWDDRANGDPLGAPDSAGDHRSLAYGLLGFTELLALHEPSGTWATYEPGVASPMLVFLDEQPTDPATTWPMVAGTLAVSGTLCSTDLGFNVVDPAFEHDSWGPTWSVDGGSGCGALPGAYGGIGPEASTTTESSARGFGAALGLNTGAAGAGENIIEILTR
ncbi:MAG: hypothetical protein EXR69_08105 [Myxococcales bacterium]|nr:hypothetical protein [Myxococcales bacterium]